MKTKVLGGIAVLAIALAIAFNVSLNLNKSNNQLSQLALANVEALAQSEDFTITCNREPVNPGNCWQFDWNYWNTDYTCYRTGYTYNHCYY